MAASKTVLLDQIDFTAPTGLVQSMDGVPNLNGNIIFYGIGYLGTPGITLTRHINYGTVDAETSGSTPQIMLTHIAYRTQDNIYHNFYPEGIKSQPMCLVNNLPHLQFQNPEGKVLANGYKEIALVKLSGDTDWTLKTLPVNLTALYDASIATTKLIVKSGGEELAITSDSLTLSPYGSAQTVIKFNGGFQHTAGKVEKGGYIDAWGRGTIKILESCKRAELPEPEMQEVDGGFNVILFKDTLTEEQLVKLKLNQRQIKAVMHVKERGRITNKEYQQIFGVAKITATRDLSSLVEKGIFKSSNTKGAGSYYEL